MANAYKAAEGSLAAAHLGVDEFEREFSPAEEADWLADGLEIVPRTYKVLSDNYEIPQGETFEAAFPVEIEAARIAGGHIQRVELPKAEPKSQPAAKKAK